MTTVAQVGSIRRLTSSSVAPWLWAAVISAMGLAASRFAFVGNLIPSALLALGGVLVISRRPQLGLVALIPVGLIVPFSLTTGTASSVNGSMLVLAVLTGICMLECLVRRRFAIGSSRTVPPLLTLCLVAAVSFVAGTESWFVFAEPAPIQARVAGLAIFYLSAAAFLLSGSWLRDARWLQWTVWTFLLMAAVYIAARLFPERGSAVLRLFQLGATGSLFWVWTVALSSSQALLNDDLKKPFRLALAALAAATLYVGTRPETIDWSAGWLPPLAALLVVLWIGSPRLGALLTVAAVVLIAADESTVAGVVMGGDNEWSLRTRLEAWTILGKISEMSPLVGTGPANYYWYTPHFPLDGYYVHFNSHSNYIDIVVEIGYLGLACFFWFVAEVGRLGWRLRGSFRDTFGRAYVAGAIGGLAGMLASGALGDWVTPFVYNVGLDGLRVSLLGWLFLGGLVALEAGSAPGNSTRGASNRPPGAI